jgi:hypothetical protein
MLVAEGSGWKSQTETCSIRGTIFSSGVLSRTVFTTFPLVDSLVEVKRALYDTCTEKSRLKDCVTKYVNSIGVE